MAVLLQLSLKKRHLVVTTRLWEGLRRFARRSSGGTVTWKWVVWVEAPDSMATCHEFWSMWLVMILGKPGGNIWKVGCLRFGNGDEVHRSAAVVPPFVEQCVFRACNVGSPWVNVEYATTTELLLVMPSV